MKPGLIQVYTGDGKGKTTAAAGLALRALSAGYRVVFIQFFKKKDSGETKLLKRFVPDCLVLNLRQSHPAFEKFTPAQMRRFRLKVKNDYGKVLSIVKSGKYDLVILDEILLGLRDGFLGTGQILELMRSKPASVELVLTGRGANSQVIRKADLVTRMEPVKHPFYKGVPPRPGIEF